MSSLIEKLPDSTVRGITLNNQHIDLFTIIDDTSKTEEEKVRDVTDYLLTIKRIKDNPKKSKGEYATAYVDYAAEKLGLLEEEKKRFIILILDNIETVFNKKEFIELLKTNGFSNAEELNSALMEAADLFITRAKEGIDKFLVLDATRRVNPKATYEKVKAFYEHVISEENGRKRYIRIDLDDTASPSCYMTIQGEGSRPSKLDKAIKFCENHGLTAKINSAFFYMHSHYPDSIRLRTREDLIRYYENYLDSISDRIQNTPVEIIDMFNEFVYRDQPQKVGDEDFQYGERHNGFHALLSTEDICSIAQRARKKLPNIKFVYNDDGWDKKEKREGIFREIEKIRNYDPTLINSIGMQFHTSINTDINEVSKAIEECRERFPDLDINITELDIGERINGFDYEHASLKELIAARIVSEHRKKLIMNTFLQAAEKGDISEVTLWSQSDEMSFRGGNSSLNSYDIKSNRYSGKEIDYTEENQKAYENALKIVSRNIAIEVAKSFKSNNIEAYKKVLKEYMPEVLENLEEYRAEVETILRNNQTEPIQDFNLHTHTMRCGHAAEFTEDFEFVNEALKAGMTRLAFTDHMPFPKGEIVEANARMQYEEIDDYLASIAYLKKEYEGLIQIDSGFEFEYIPEFEEHIKELKSKTDIMILGQHFVENEQGKRKSVKHGNLTDDELTQYTNLVLKAIDSGYPDIIAHPDYFMFGRKEFGEKERNAAIAICEAASKKGIHLEINMGSISQSASSIDKDLPEAERIKQVASKVRVPCLEFWKIAQEKGCSVVYGKDAHWPGQLLEDRDYEIIKAILGEELLKGDSEKALRFVNQVKIGEDNSASEKQNAVDEQNLEER